jgi:hypothetical protein
MNLKCDVCGATIFTPSNDTDYHKRLIDGHKKTFHGDPTENYIRTLTKTLALVNMIIAKGGIPGFSRDQAQTLANEIGETLGIPRTTSVVAPPTVGVGAAPAPTVSDEKKTQAGT